MLASTSQKKFTPPRLNPVELQRTAVLSGTGAQRTRCNGAKANAPSKEKSMIAWRKIFLNFAKCNHLKNTLF